LRNKDYIMRRRKQEQEKYKIQGYKIKHDTWIRINMVNWGRLSWSSFPICSIILPKLTTICCIELITKWKEYIYSLTHDQRKKKERV
jgi:hypothetical protein